MPAIQGPLSLTCYESFLLTMMPLIFGQTVEVSRLIQPLTLVIFVGREIHISHVHRLAVFLV